MGKIAVAGKLLDQELSTLKLKRHDLAKADLTLGEKAYLMGSAGTESQLVSTIERVTEQLRQLREKQIDSGSTFAEKAKAIALRIFKVVQIGVLELQRRRMLRQLGGSVRQSATDNKLAAETQAARGVADRVSALEAEIS